MGLEAAGHYAVWASASVLSRARQRWPGPVVASPAQSESEGLIVVGGGGMMDEAKYFRARHRPGMRLILVPSLWGSGAERSPVVVLNRDGGKHIETDRSFLPDDVVYWPELLQTVTPETARRACGDVWAHALECILSPLCSDEDRSLTAALIAEMLSLPLATDARWFEASANACKLQSQASVGLVHGIAHVLESPLNAAFPGCGWGHARLCSIFLLPVMELNRKNSPKWQDLVTQYGLDGTAIGGILMRLHEPDAYRQALPSVKAHWPRILRDPCTRTNGTLVRAQAVQFLEEWAAA